MGCPDREHSLRRLLFGVGFFAYLSGWAGSAARTEAVVVDIQLQKQRLWGASSLTTPSVRCQPLTSHLVESLNYTKNVKDT